MTLPEKIIKMCEKRGWSLHWTCRGAYLHLEASELIECIRGKRRGDKTEEAADVLIVLMSITESNGIDWRSVLSQADKKVSELMTKPKYAGEERVVL